MKNTSGLHHLGIIPDGNRRWAKQNNLPSFEGHRRGALQALKLAKTARKLDIHTVTLWGFSTENWNRNKKEISGLMNIFVEFITNYIDDALKDGVRLVHIGRKYRFNESVKKAILRAEQKTKNCKRHILNLALDYGGHDEILRAIQKYVHDIKNKKTKNSDIDKIDSLYNNRYPIYRFHKYLDTTGQPYPYPDLIIRTSGEQRTSGFLPWQSVYAELYFSPKCFPDFSPKDLKKAVNDFKKRNRRFGSN